MPRFCCQRKSKSHQLERWRTCGHLFLSISHHLLPVVGVLQSRTKEVSSSRVLLLLPDEALHFADTLSIPVICARNSLQDNAILQTTSNHMAPEANILYYLSYINGTSVGKAIHGTFPDPCALRSSPIERSLSVNAMSLEVRHIYHRGAMLSVNAI